MPSSLPSAFIAARLLARHAESGGVFLYVGTSERRAGDVARLLAGLDPQSRALFYPAWDCLPYDRASPSTEVMGARMSVLRAVGRGEARFLITTPEALVQRTPPRSLFERESWRLSEAESLDPEALGLELFRLGYQADGRVDEPGEFAIRGEVIDIYGAADLFPHRLEMDDGRIASIRTFDPLSQRTIESVGQLALSPASEAVFDGEGSPEQPWPGLEHALASFYPALDDLFDFASGAELIAESGAAARGSELLRQAATAYRERLSAHSGLTEEEPTRPPSAPDRLYLTPDAWTERMRNAGGLPTDDFEPMRRFATERAPARALARFVQGECEAGRRVVLTAAAKRDLARLRAAATRENALGAQPAASWAEVVAAAPGAVLTLHLDADGGFVDERAGLALVAASDLLGSRVRSGPDSVASNPFAAGEDALSVGDVVIHEAHGLGVLRGLETVETEALGRRETVRIDYAKEARLLAPVEELSKVWRYGSEEAAVTLDRLDGDAWAKRREKTLGEIAVTARELVELAKAREQASAPKLEPPRREYETFVAGFPFTPTPDQQTAIEAVLADLASGRPMDRLVVGDVGFGKTEVALRAAAATVLAGKQVAVAAPTTVLVRQHVETFRRRFAELGFEVAHLSRLVSATGAKSSRRAWRTARRGWSSAPRRSRGRASASPTSAC